MAIDKLSGAPPAFQNYQDKLNEVIEALKPLLNLQGLGNIKVTPADANITISFTGITGGSTTDSDPHAFKPYLDSGSLYIRSGYLNEISVDTTGDTVSYSIGAVYLYYLDVTVDGEGIATAATVARGSSLPDDDTTHGYVELFEVDELGAVTSQHVKSSLRHAMCGGVHQFGGLG